MSAIAYLRQCRAMITWLIVTSLVTPVVTKAAASACTMTATEIPVTMVGSRPQISAKINGDEVHFLVDSGAFYSLLSPASAAEHHLPIKPAPFGLEVTGVGGDAAVSLTTVKVFTLATVPLHDIQFLVGGSEAGYGSVGVLGQNVWRLGDMEYDLAHGFIHIVHPENCKGAVLAYWVPPGQAYSMIDINSTTAGEPHTTGAAYVNGEKIKVLFDTGAWLSVLTLKAAERAGIKLDSPNLVDAGYASGIGRGQVREYLARVSSFKIGDEEIRNTRLRVVDAPLPTGDMLLGADFFLSHHIYVASGQRKLYFTYNGGPVFNLTGKTSAGQSGPAVASGAATDTPAPTGGPDSAAPPEQAGHTDQPPLQPRDAAELSRLGMAAAGRRDFETAVANLKRAVELAPDNADYVFELGSIHRRNQQPDLAMAAFNRAIELKPDHIPALMDRAEMRIDKKDIEGAKEDLDAVDKIAAKQSDVRFEVAGAYERAGLLKPSVAQYEMWALAHQVDSKYGYAMSGLCAVRAVLNEDLPEALRNCNGALKLAAKGSAVAAQELSNRGMVRLRLGDNDKAIADYDASLQLRPRNAYSLYGRGIAKIRKSKTAEGEADLAAAADIVSHIAEQFQTWGISP